MPQTNPSATTPLSHAGQRVLISAAASGIGLVTRMIQLPALRVAR